MKLIGMLMVSLLLAMQLHAAELTTFQAGDPIYASELNGNFLELEARINALTLNAQQGSEGLAGEPFNIFLPGNSDPVALEPGYDYYITDAIWPQFIRSFSSCSSSSGNPYARAATTVGGINFILEVPAQGAGGTCSIVGNSVSLKTPVVVSGDQSLASYDTLNTGLRVIGYRVSVLSP